MKRSETQRSYKKKKAGLSSKEAKVFTMSDLIDELADEFKETLNLSGLVVKTVFDSIKSQIKKDGRVEIRGFGSFELRKYSPYTGRNPSTGQVVSVKAKKLPFFKAGLPLKKQLNSRR